VNALLYVYETLSIWTGECKAITDDFIDILKMEDVELKNMKISHSLSGVEFSIRCKIRGLFKNIPLTTVVLGLCVSFDRSGSFNTLRILVLNINILEEYYYSTYKI
jgi:hypothetical protein